MHDLTRRGFLTRSSAGIAVAAALAAIPGAATVLRHSNPVEAPSIGPIAISGEPLIAHVRDLDRGEVLLLVGTREVAYRDVELARRLYAAAQRSI